MFRKIIPILLVFVLLNSLQPSQAWAGGAFSIYLPVVHSLKPFYPVLKWKYGGCTSWCETGWYSSPAVADVNGDGLNEVIASAYSLWALNGNTGQTIWSVKNTSNRTWPGVVVADLNHDGSSEVVIAQSGGWVSAFTLGGSPLWKKQPAGSSGEFRGLLAADLDGNGSSMEIVVTRAFGSATNTWVLDSNGNIRSGWPQLGQNSQNGYAWGVYNANAAAANISGDGRLELVVPSDVHYINAYEPDGLPLKASSFYGNKYWGLVGVWEDLAVEQRGWGECDGVRAESYRANFADGPAVLSDLDGDGKLEVVVTGNMYDCNAGYPPSRYTSLYIFNADRSRFNSGGFDWRTIPTDTGAPLMEDYSVIESVEANPAVADLDGDGKKEILFPSYDGRMHAFWLDKSEHGAWPYAVTKPGEGVIRFASEPVIADLDQDGKAEVIFTSWTQKGSQKNGKLHILDATGKPLFELDLPDPLSSSETWNGAMAAPTLANIDSDPDLELVINTANSGVVAYDLMGTAGATVLWGTGRGNFGRTGGQ